MHPASCPLSTDTVTAKITACTVIALHKLLALPPQPCVGGDLVDVRTLATPLSPDSRLAAPTARMPASDAAMPQ